MMAHAGGGPSSSVIAGITVAVTVPITATIATIITAVSILLYHHKKKQRLPQEYEQQAAFVNTTARLAMTNNEAYGQLVSVYMNPNVVINQTSGLK